MLIQGGNLQYDNEQNKNKKLSRIVLIFIVLIFIAIIAIICTIMYLQQTVFRVYIDGQLVNLSQDMIVTDATSNKSYVDIKGIAQYLGYEAHNGEYKLYTEDTNKCWVYSQTETASFFLNSNKISKVTPEGSKDYEDYTIQDPIININGKLYCSYEGLQIGFNSKVQYDANANTLQIFTLPYLVEQYNTILKQYGYEGVDDNFNNQKAILYDLLVVKGGNNLYGVINSKNEEKIGSRYKTIEFNENAKEFYVSNSSNKVGIITTQGDTKINLLYDSISMIDKKNGLYLVKNSNKYGILGDTGETIIHLEYDEIGINSTKIDKGNIKNSYVLFENAIPVYQNKKWGLFDIKGNIILPLEFDYLGYTVGSSNNVNGNSVLVIPNYKAIVLGKIKENEDKKENKYGVYSYLGENLIPCSLDSCYSTVSAGVTTYYMEYKGETINVEEYIGRVLGLSSDLTEEEN